MNTSAPGPGAFSDDVVRTLPLEHQLQTSTGGCPTVALGGFLLGGGHPIIARSTGAGVDNVLGHEVVLANNTVVYTSATQHPELYWGLRGSCGLSFGLVTSFRMKAYPDTCAGPGGCYAGHLIYAPKDITTVAEVFATHVPNADPKLGMEAFMFTGVAGYPSAPHGGFLVPGVWNGFPARDGLRALQPLSTIPNVTILENTFAKRSSYREAWHRRPARPDGPGSAGVHPVGVPVQAPVQCRLGCTVGWCDEPWGERFRWNERDGRQVEGGPDRQDILPAPRLPLQPRDQHRLVRRAAGRQSQVLDQCSLLRAHPSGVRRKGLPGLLQLPRRPPRWEGQRPRLYDGVLGE